MSSAFNIPAESNDPGRDRQIGISDEGHDSFWKWIRKAYRDPDALATVFSLWNMQVAYKAGWLESRSAAPPVDAVPGEPVAQDVALWQLVYGAMLGTDKTPKSVDDFEAAAKRVAEMIERRALAASVAVQGEPAAWTRPGFPGAFISNAEKIQGGDGEWERDYTIPLYAASVAPRAGSEPVMWQSRFFDSTSSVTPGWGKWEEVVPRNAYTDTVEDRLRELRHYIAAGYKYELRALYAIAPAAAAGGSEPVALADQAVAAPEAVGRVLAYINAAPAEWGEQLHAINGCKLFRADLAAIAAPSVLPAQEESFYVRFAKEWITASDNERKSIGEFVEGWGPIDPAVSAGEAQS